MGSAKEWQQNLEERFSLLEGQSEDINLLHRNKHNYAFSWFFRLHMLFFAWNNKNHIHNYFVENNHQGRLVVFSILSSPNEFHGCKFKKTDKSNSFSRKCVGTIHTAQWKSFPQARKEICCLSGAAWYARKMIR